MLRTDEILSTIQMLHAEHLDVRTVTLGINVDDCAASSVDNLCRKLREKILRRAGNLVRVCDKVGAKYGIPVVNKRLALSPAAQLLAGHGLGTAIRLAQTLDATAQESGIDLVGGFTALVHKGISSGDAVVLDSLPDVLAGTQRVCASVNVATHRAGINMDAVRQMGELLLRIAVATAAQRGFGCAKLVIFSNIPEDNPFMAGAYLGAGEPGATVNIGVSGPGVVNSALRRRLELGGPFGIVDLSLAPTPAVGDSVGEILRTLGVTHLGAPGSTAAIALLTDAIKKGGAFASSSVGGMSGAFIPVSEDSALAMAARDGQLTLEKLEAMTSVCSVGLDMIAVPGDTSAETLAAIIADEMAIGVMNNKTTGVRLIAVPGAKAGDWVEFGGLFGAAPVMPIRNTGASAPFVLLGGRIPAPIQSLRN